METQTNESRSREIVGKQVEVQIGLYSNHVKTSAIILEQIGYGFLARSEGEKYCSVHYDLRGRLCAKKLFDSESEARSIAEESKHRIS